MLIIFDLDFTLWDCGGTWCDHTSPPYSKQNGIILDSDNRRIKLYPEVHTILRQLKDQQTALGVASRTHAPEYAEELMQLFEIKKFFDHTEIYPGSKLTHFKSIKQKTGISYKEMVFFDDEYRNVDEVSKLGVDAVYVEQGINRGLVAPYLR